MADEAFALSPIAARATQPSEADYDAISEAFMETARGRWFLGEYAKRNRNADTRLVLEAVARIEETLAVQKKPARDPLLDEALAALRGALGDAKDAAQAAIGDLAFEENLNAVRKGTRVIREISWRLREIGADGRICDLIDSQVGAIEGAAAKLVPGDLAAALSRAFDQIEQRIAAFGVSDAQMPAPSAEAMEGATAPAPPADELADLGEAVETMRAADDAETVISDEAEAAAVVETEPTDAFGAEDEAVLDLVALEMAAPDTDAAYEPLMVEMSDGELPEPEAPVAPVAKTTPARTPPVHANVAAETDSISAADIEFTFVTAVSEMPAASVRAAPASPAPASAAPIKIAPEAEASSSLGSSLLANGIVQRPRISKPDPLAPIRRMSQSEKIAFFS